MSYPGAKECRDRGFYFFSTMTSAWGEAAAEDWFADRGLHRNVHWMQSGERTYAFKVTGQCDVFEARFGRIPLQSRVLDKTESMEMLQFMIDEGNDYEGSFRWENKRYDSFEAILNRISREPEFETTWRMTFATKDEAARFRLMWC